MRSHEKALCAASEEAYSAPFQARALFNSQNEALIDNAFSDVLKASLY